MGGKLNLFDGEGEAEDELVSEIKINKEFARRYEHNKKREDLQRLEELKKKGLVNDSDSEDAESSEEEDDDGGIASAKSKKKDAEFFDALIKVKKQDPVLKNKEAKLFDSDSNDSESEDEDDNGNSSDNDNEVVKSSKDVKKKKKMYLKDVMSKHLIEEGPEFNDDEEDLNGENGVSYRNRVKSYSEEQEEMRKEFLRAVEKEVSEEGGELLKVKERKGQNEDDDEDEEVIVEKLDEYFGKDEKLDENEMFLKDYFRKRMWESRDDRIGGEDGEGVEFSEDEDEIERQENYEREFNFRFEESAGDRVMGHARKVEGSVRNNTNARQRQREEKEKRRMQAELERKEELKRLKNLKKKEINEKLQKIRETAGLGEDDAYPLDINDLEAEFDPEEHDKKMKQAFNDEYYEAEDPEFASDQDKEDADGLEKPDFDKEDELLGLPRGWDSAHDAPDGFLSVREKFLKQLAEGEADPQQEGEEDVVVEMGKRKRKRKKISEVEKAIREQLMEEYYKLDYEDTIGDLKTRFKYRPVKANRLGLRTEEVLMLDDKELNQLVPLKKLAPYQEKEPKVIHTKLQQQKKKFKELLQGESSGVTSAGKKRRDDDHKDPSAVSTTGNQMEKTEESTVDTRTLSRKRKRKLNQANLKLSEKRRMAYGKNPL